MDTAITSLVPTFWAGPVLVQKDIQYNGNLVNANVCVIFLKMLGLGVDFIFFLKRKRFNSGLGFSIATLLFLSSLVNLMHVVVFSLLNTSS